MFNFKEIEKITNGKIINGNDIIIGDYNLSNTSFYKGTFYVPIIFHGVDYEKNIIPSVKNGCIGFMINKNSADYDSIIKEALSINPNLCILAVDDVNHALVNLGLEARKLNLNKEIVAITGSYGKSTLTSLVSKILETERKVLYDFKSYNKNTRWHISQLLQYFTEYDMAVLELGVSQQNTMKYLSDMTKPSIAVITSIGSAHINNFKTEENILKEKMHIVDDLKDKKILFINDDDEYLKQLEDSNEYKLIRYSINEAYDINEDFDGISFKTKIYNKETLFNLNLYGIHHVRNIIAAIKIAQIYNIKYENIIRAINEFKPVHGRFKPLRNKEKNIIVIDDVYNSCYESVEYGLQETDKINSKRKIAVLGTVCSGIDIDETSNFHEKIGEYFSTLDFDYLYLYGNYTKCIYKGAIKEFPEKNVKRFKDKKMLIQDLINSINEGDLIYIKDAGLQKFEDIVYSLSDKYNLR